MSDMLKDHKTDIAAFNKKATGRVPMLRSLPRRPCPLCENTLEQAESVTGKIEQASKMPEGPAQH
jgi:hypothetical protein